MIIYSFPRNTHTHVAVCAKLGLLLCSYSFVGSSILPFSLSSDYVLLAMYIAALYSACVAGVDSMTYQGKS